MTVVILSSHAKQRLTERKISESLVRRCLTSPDKVLRSKNDGEEKKNAMKVNGRVLILVFRQIDTDIFFVITAFESSKFKRYLG